MKRWRFGFYALDFVIVLCIVALLLQVLQQSGSGGKEAAGEMHFVLIMPSQDSEEGNVRESAERLAERYQLDIEFHAFSTVAEQAVFGTAQKFGCDEFVETGGNDAHLHLFGY